ncbi:M16 family metallopeptidase [Nostoc sp. 'Lobaria pulmonaria (5183) cyanobiont']|uniref:M16 family metallopeptidase n=1 Tax=Nostoc sp. 'Lobaria pulmonaria (5183) cyanobiont' TaxID=1618022 RepID=UPI000CF2FEFB|nr:pitrilysin family protein [Nostoc sp. 'Lobaria pulmonaria (5183) cyanobiont']AVH72873.1 peptidase M16 [Nostoc sp. 'Lobaria pulmonaria (5183) cyanobiont']
MYGFSKFYSKFYKYPLPLLLLSLWLVAVFLLSDRPAHSQHPVISNKEKYQSTLLAKRIMPSTLTENVRKTVLENGLTVLTKEVHTAPVVTVQVWYKVGSRNEEPGVNGIAHQLEHMMFKGTLNRPIQFGRLFGALGSDSNAFTSYDQTAYYSTVERNKLKALLVLEADRMRNSQIEPEQLASEKRVVISELQGYENSPEYRLNRAVMQAVFPNHAYGLPVGGTKADVEKFEVEQVEKYYRNFYSPDNAVLVIVGDFQTANTLETIKEVFGKLPRQEAGGRGQEAGVISPSLSTQHGLNAPLPLTALSTPIVLREPGAGQLLQVVYPLPDANQPDVPALDVMDYILTEGRNSRLYQALVESGLASEVTASVTSLRESGWYEVLVTAGSKQDLKKIDLMLSSAIANVAEKGVTSEEVERAKTQLTADVILSNRDITSQAMRLGTDETTVGDYSYTDRYLAAVRLVKSADVVAVINKYLTKEARTVGFFEPTQKRITEVADKPDSAQTTENFSPGAPVLFSEVIKYLPPVDLATDAIAQVLPDEFKFTNGLRILLLPDRSTPTVTLSGYIQAGTEFDLENKAGLAAFVADNLLNGTNSKDVFTIAKVLGERGASLDFQAYREGVHIEGDSLAEDLPILLEILADVVKNSNFPVKELELHRQQTLTELQLELDEPSEVARRVFVQSIYPKKHPLHTFPTDESLQQIQRQDVIDFKAKHYRPDTTVLALVGDFDLDKVRSLIKNKFGDWEVNGKAPTLKYPTVAMPEKIVSVNPVLPDKTQAVTYMGYTGINRYDPRFHAALVLNQILGGDTLSSRLGAEVRDRQGLSYGIYSSFQALKNVGTFLIEMQTSPEDSSKAIASTCQILQQIHQQGVTVLEVETAKRTLISNYNVSLANPEELTDRILMNEVYGLDKVELHSFTDKIQKVTLTQVNQAARELLHSDKIVVVTAGPSVSAEKSIR